MAAKSKPTDWFDNYETDSDTSLDEKNVEVKIKASGSPAQKLPKLAKSSSKVAKMAINGTSNKDQTSSSSDENTSDDEIKENAAKLELIQGKEKLILSCYLGTYHFSYRQNNNHEKCTDLGLNCIIPKDLYEKYYIKDD